MTTTSVKLQNNIAEKLEDISRRSGIEKGELINTVLSRQLSAAGTYFVADVDNDSFQKAQEALAGYAKEAGYEGEQEILDDIS